MHHSKTLTHEQLMLSKSLFFTSKIRGRNNPKLIHINKVLQFSAWPNMVTPYRCKFLRTWADINFACIPYNLVPKNCNSVQINHLFSRVKLKALTFYLIWKSRITNVPMLVTFIEKQINCKLAYKLRENFLKNFLQEYNQTSPTDF